VDRSEVDAALTAVEQGLDSANADMGPFWRAIAAMKRDTALVDEFADRAAAIDRRAFEGWALLKIPIWAGTALLALGTVVGLFLVLLAYYAGRPGDGLLLLVGTVITLTTTHGLAHLAVGVAVGMRFTHVFVGTVTRPQPGVKVDYATYLRTPARRRAWMHASGAVVTKIIPFAALGPAVVIPVQGWVTALLAALGIAQILTDLMWSVKSSDWKKYRREMRYVGNA
jgi:hypothetical protein